MSDDKRDNKSETDKTDERYVEIKSKLYIRIMPFYLYKKIIINAVDNICEFKESGMLYKYYASNWRILQMDDDKLRGYCERYLLNKKFDCIIVSHNQIFIYNKKNTNIVKNYLD